ncbi:MFS transporter [Clostridium ihumii]|uniref:MFS transporter n=1 Tax=Clostridium ihumii TaxID=1470356 RepID=UPI003D32B477
MKRKTNLLQTYRGLPKEVYILFFGKMINCIGAFVFPLLSLILTQKIGLTVKEAGSLVTFAAILQAPCIILGGKLVDSVGRKKVIVIFQGIASILFIVCGFINPSKKLAYMIIVAACFSSFANPAYDSMVGDITTKENRKASFSLIYMGLNLGFSVGPIIGGLLYENYLPLVFIGDAITTLISLSLITIFIKETHVKNEDEKNSSDEFESEESGSVIKVFLKRPILIYFALIMLTFQFAYAQWGFAIPIQLGSIFGSKGAKYFGLLSGCNGILVIILTPILTACTRKIDILKIISFGGLLYAIAFGLCGFIEILPMFFMAIAIMTLGEVAISTNSGTFITNLTPASHRGRVNAVIPLIYGTGNAIGPFIMGNMLESYGVTTSWMVISIVVLVGSVFMYLLRFNKLLRKN